jgi:hypothetical protein
LDIASVQRVRERGVAQGASVSVTSRVAVENVSAGRGLVEKYNSNAPEGQSVESLAAPPVGFPADASLARF